MRPNIINKAIYIHKGKRNIFWVFLNLLEFHCNFIFILPPINAVFNSITFIPFQTDFTPRLYITFQFLFLFILFLYLIWTSYDICMIFILWAWEKFFFAMTLLFLEKCRRAPFVRWVIISSNGIRSYTHIHF